jgi:hypothetical protein
MDKLADADSAETLKNSILKLAKQTSGRKTSISSWCCGVV